MKLISLNTWMGIVKEPLMDFISAKRHDVDIFCFQEILNGGAEDAPRMWKDTGHVKDHQLLQHLQELLPDHRSFFYPHLSHWAGLGIFVHSNVELLEEGEFFVHGTQASTMGENDTKFNPHRNIQFAKVVVNEKPITIINFHSLWNGGAKLDNPERLSQSARILEYTRKLNNDYVLCGDFNLEPNTESLKLLEASGLRNLIKEYGITSTRTKFYDKPVKFADYVLVSRGIEVDDFKVLLDEVSDHAAMYLDFQ